jgi:hypothetical protein
MPKIVATGWRPATSGFDKVLTVIGGFDLLGSV